jgi:hypothetical protein
MRHVLGQNPIASHSVDRFGRKADFDDHHENGENAQIADIPGRLGEWGKSTLCYPSRSVL